MNTRRSHCAALTLQVFCAAFLVFQVTTRARVLDDFNDNAKTGWTDFTFAPGAGTMVEANSQFRFEIPAAVIQAIDQPLFCASTKSSETFTLQEGRTIEFRVDVVSGGAGRSYATLAFIPTSSGGPNQLKGYSLAKSTTDVLLVKGINQYFIDDDTETVPEKQQNITLVLRLTARGGTVTINGQILDRDQNNAVLWERTFEDTPAADPLGTGTDTPPAPFIGSGNLVLYLYADYTPGNPATLEDPYVAVYDNAEVFVTDTVVVDDFNDNTKTGWSDFSFVGDFGKPTEQDGQFRFELPGAVMAQAGQPLFAASTKASPLVELKEGERVEFQVDVVSGGLKDSFAILAFIPSSAGGPATLKGYSFAKSITDVLIVKGIDQYFVADDEATAELKQEDITMSLGLVVRNGTVTIDAKILDRADNNAVLWHRVIQDTPAADLMEGGTDNPAAPYLGTGNFVLMLFADYAENAPEDPYFVVFDNARISMAPQIANVAPVLSDILPQDRANFLSSPGQVSFKVSDDAALENGRISVTVNGTNFFSTNGLAITGSGNERNVTLGGLGPQVNYTVTIRAEDVEGQSVTRTIFFDTFTTNNTIVLEAENYNFNSGQFIDQVVLIPEGAGDPASYSLQVATDEIDYFDTEAGPSGFTDNPFRPDDKTETARTRDFARAKYVAAGGGELGIYDYDVAQIAANEWMNYTHTFPQGSYEVYLREAIANLPTAESVLERVTNDSTQPQQTTQLLGSFLGTLTGFTHRNVPLTDASGQNKAILRLDGQTTLRLRQITADTEDGVRWLNYLVFVPTAEAGEQRATVTAVEPAAGSSVSTVDPRVAATIENRDTQVRVDSVKLELNGLPVQANVTATASGAQVAYTIDPLPASGSTNTAKVLFEDNSGKDLSTEWKFVINYRSVDPALRIAGTGEERGFNVRVVQAQTGQPTENSLAYAESLLKPNPTLLLQYDTNVIAQAINFSQSGPGSSDGSFPEDELIPGLDTFYSSEDIAMEATAYLELAAGKYRFGTHSDDGYKVQVVPSFTARDTAPLAFHNGGPANETYDFVVTEGGLYPFRLVWNERGGGAHVEWFQQLLTGNERFLVNSDSPGAVRTYVTIEAAQEPPRFTSTVLSNGQLTIQWTGGGVLQQSSNLSSWTDVPGQPAGSFSVNTASTSALFFRVRQ